MNTTFPSGCWMGHQGPLDIETEIQGYAFETLILQELIAQNSYKQLEYELFFWRTKYHIEVDFILYGPRGLIAIEVKGSSRVRGDDYLALSEFLKDYPNAQCYLVYTGSKNFNHGKISVLSASYFLKNTSKLL